MSLIGWTVATRRNNLPSAGAGRTWRHASPPVAPQRALSQGSGAFSADSGLHLSRVSVTRFRGVDGLLRGFPCWLWGRLLSACERELVLARARPCRGQVVAVVRGDSTLTTLTLPRRPHRSAFPAAEMVTAALPRLLPGSRLRDLVAVLVGLKGVGLQGRVRPLTATVQHLLKLSAAGRSSWEPWLLSC